MVPLQQNNYLGAAEIREGDGSTCAHQDVFGFEVAVHHLVEVQVIQRLQAQHLKFKVVIEQGSLKLPLRKSLRTTCFLLSFKISCMGMHDLAAVQRL